MRFRALLVWSAVALSLALPQTEIADVKVCRSTVPAEICLQVFFKNESLSGEVVAMCRTYSERQHTPEYIDPEWIAIASSAKCSDMSAPCSVTVPGLLPSTTYYVFCSGWQRNSPILRPWPQCLDNQPKCGVKATTSVENGPGSHLPFTAINCGGAVLLVIYILWSFAFEHVRILHETGMAVLAGLAIGFLVKAVSGQTAEFSYSTFSLLLLPMVIFSAGFNLQKGNFFRYSTYIVSLGVTGTVLIFVLIYWSSWLFEFRSHDGDRVSLTHHQRLIMASVLASTDSVAPMAFLPSEIFPRLFSVVFGEGVFNDVVSILLSTATASSTSLPSFLSLCGNISFFFTTSLAVGLFFGFGTSFMFRIATPLRFGVIKPCALIVVLNYLCYVVAEVLGFSSIFALFVCAVLSGHYAAHWLSHKARVFSQEFAEMLAYCAEAVVFGYFGLTAVAHIAAGSYCFGLIGAYFIAIVLARVFAVTLVALGLRVLKWGHRLSISASELAIIGIAGCMRGTIAYALILRSMPKRPNPLQEILISTVLGIVLLNAVLAGPLFPLALRLFGITGGGTCMGNGADSELPSRNEAGMAIADAGSVHGSTVETWSNVRNRLHACWHLVDNRFLKPLLRPSPTELQQESESL